MDGVHLVETPDQFADYIMDELGRWVASECPINFKSRRFKTNMFPFLESVCGSSLQLKFTKTGYVIIRATFPVVFDDTKVARFNIADPKLKNNLSDCIDNLRNQIWIDFIPISKAQKLWRR